MSKNNLKKRVISLNEQKKNANKIVIHYILSNGDSSFAPATTSTHAQAAKMIELLLQGITFPFNMIYFQFDYFTNNSPRLFVE
jgi:hypothetical protein